MPEAAPSDHHGRRLVLGDLPSPGRERLLPMLAAPLGGICGIDSDDGQSGPGGHDDQPPTENAGREAGDEVAEPALPAMALTRCGRIVEAEILDGDRTDSGSSSKTDDPADCVTKLRVPAKAGPGEVKWDTRWPTYWVASGVHRPAGMMIGIEVDGYHSVGYGVAKVIGGDGAVVHEASRYHRLRSGLNQMA